MSNQTEKTGAITAWSALNPAAVTQGDKDSLAGYAQRLEVSVVPPPVTGLIAATPWSGTSRPTWMGDFLKPDKLFPVAPYNDFYDRAKNLISPSRSGVDATRYVRSGPWGNGGGYREPIPALSADGTNTEWLNPNFGDAEYGSQLVKPGVVNDVVGPRGKCMPSPYITWRAHPTFFPSGPNRGQPIPRAPLYVGYKLNGEVYELHARGDALPEYKLIGQVPGVESGQGISLFPPNPKIFFVTDYKKGMMQPNGIPLPLPNSGRLIRVDRTAAAAARPPGGNEDPSLWVTTDVVTGLGAVTSINCLDDGTMFIACKDRTEVRGVGFDQAGNVLSNDVVYHLPSPPYALCHTSAGLVASLGVDMSVYVVDPHDPVIGASLFPPGGRIKFGMISCDVNGTWGLKDRLAFNNSHSGSGSASGYFLDGPGWTNRFSLPTGSSRSLGDTAFCNDVYGHYPWVDDFHIDQGLLLNQGYTNTSPIITRPVHDKDPPRVAWNHQLWGDGRAVYFVGTVAGLEGTKPSFTCQTDARGFSLIGLSLDNLANMSKSDGSADFDAMKAYIQQGMAGSFPRPEIVGYPLYTLLYFVLGCSHRLIKEGQLLLDALKVWAGNPPRAGIPAQRAPTSFYAKCAQEGPLLKVKFYNPEGYVVAAPVEATVQVIVDEGMPNAVIAGMASAANSYLLPIPAVAVGKHILSGRASAGINGEATLWAKV